MTNPIFRNLLLAVTVFSAPFVLAADDPAHERHEIMEGVRDATKPVGAMLKGEKEFDAAVLQASLSTYADAAAVFADLFPAGSEGGEAAAAIWEDRAGFEAAVSKWSKATDAAIAADPQSLDDARPVVGAVLQNCKGCHDSYRIED